LSLWTTDVGVTGPGVRVAESAMEPPSSIPNLVVPHGSAGEYCAGNCVGGEAAARTPGPGTQDSFTHDHRGVEQWQLVGLITQRSQVRILPPLPRTGTGHPDRSLFRVPETRPVSRARMNSKARCGPAAESPTFPVGALLGYLPVVGPDERGQWIHGRDRRDAMLCKNRSESCEETSSLSKQPGRCLWIVFRACTCCLACLSYSRRQFQYEA
jgi:hypothetical protein